MLIAEIAAVFNTLPELNRDGFLAGTFIISEWTIVFLKPYTPKEKDFRIARNYDQT